ncbi:N-acetylmuramoyl-L-alanine amidase [Streptomyces sp. DSM 41987]|uniref:N-acetylmuramoyl-L-alanine amidase n=2 Tax=Streptomyces TaxID=1883 RepID=UPI0036202EC0
MPVRGRHGRSRSRVVTGITAAVAVSALAVGAYASASPAGHGQAASPAGASRALQADFSAAAAEFQVPESVLLAVSYHQTRWESHQGAPSATGNFNVMGLTQVDASAVPARTDSERRADLNQRGEGGASAAQRFRPDKAALAAVGSVRTSDPALHTLDAAAALIDEPAKALRTDPRESVRGGAALLASYEKQAHGKLAADPGQWYDAVARYTQSPDTAAANQFADRVFATIRTGATRTTADGQQVTLAAAPSVVPAAPAPTRTAKAAGAKAAAAAECPSGLVCDVVPAAYQGTNAADPAVYGNYDKANRPADGQTIRYIVIHDTESDYSSAVNIFQNPTSYVSANYLVRAKDGLVSQVVPTKDEAWHAGSKVLNMHSLGVEHEGFALTNASWYTEAQYESSAALVRYLAARFNIPLDRQHIIGHDDVTGPTDDYVAGMHYDPGTYWDWSHYMDLLGAPLGGNGAPIVGGEITIAPPFTTANQPVVTGCDGKTSTSPCPARPANFVYLRTSPSASAALIKDALVAKKGATGTIQGADWTDKAVSGQTFIVADVQGDWTAIWYAGQKAWFFNPGGQNAVANSRTAQKVVTPAGSAAVPVYGRSYPEESAYPAVLSAVGKDPKQQVVATSYTMPAGQAYVADAPIASDFFYAQNVNMDAPGDHTLVVGTTTYYPIRYNHRIAFVKASDVTTVEAAKPPTGTYTPTGPTRVLDTRSGLGAAKAPVGPGASIALQVAGVGAVPATGVTAVVLNVTAVAPTSGGFVSVYPDGQPRPGVSNLNFSPQQTIANLVVVPVINGKIDFYNLAGNVNLLADLTGYYSTSTTGSRFNSAGPTRVLDTRSGLGAAKAPVGPGASIALQVAGVGAVPATGVTAVVLNVTAVAPTSGGFVSVYPDGQPRPGVSNLNFVAKQTIPNLVVVPVVNGKVDFYNLLGTVDLLADLTGYYTSTGSVFNTAGPTRVLDTRSGTGGIHAPVGPGGTITLQIAGRAGLPATGVTAVVLNVTAVAPTSGGFVSVYPDGQPRPGVSNLNFVAKQTIPNLVVVPVVNGKVDFYNLLGNVHLLADLTGYYTS